MLTKERRSVNIGVVSVKCGKASRKGIQTSLPTKEGGRGE